MSIGEVFFLGFCAGVFASLFFALLVHWLTGEGL